MDNNYLNISRIVKHNLCLNCGICVSVCPVNAISLKRSEVGYIPQINENKCLSKAGCSTCIKVCPGHGINIKQMSSFLFPYTHKDDAVLGRYLKIYTAHSLNYDIRYHSSSGGVVTQMLVSLLDSKKIDGALVTGMNKEKPLEPNVFIAKSREEIIQAQSSKYCPVPLGIGLKEIINTKGRFAVVGLPCHIHGFRKAEQIYSILREKVFLYLGLFCSSVKTFNATEYLLRQRNFFKSNIVFFKYRDEGCLGSMVVRFKSGDIFKEPFQHYYPPLRSFFIPFRCTLCIDHTAELADISFGDIHIPEYWDDKVGTSAIIIRSQKALDYFLEIKNKGDIQCNDLNRSLLIKSQKNMIERKKKHYTVRNMVCKFFFRHTPRYDGGYDEVTFRKSLKYLLSTVILYVEIWIGCKKKLWWSISFLNKIAKLVARMKKK